MPLTPPPLDTRTFEQLFEEARLRIPLHTREWTDFNDSDPGITLVQLFAWFTETMLAQMNQVPELHYVKFLELLGLEVNSAQPAKVYLTFKGLDVDQLTSRAAVIEKRTQIGGEAESEDAKKLVIFETEKELDPIRVNLTHVWVHDDSGFKDQVDANNSYDSPAFYPFGKDGKEDAELYLGFAPPKKTTTVSLFPPTFSFYVFKSNNADDGSSPIMAKKKDRASFVPTRTIWEYKSEDPLKPWMTLFVKQDNSYDFTQSGYIELSSPRKFMPTIYEDIPGTVEKHYWLRCRVIQAYPPGRAPLLDGIHPNTVLARSLTTQYEEVLGESDGRPNQSFILEKKPVAHQSLKLLIEGSGGSLESWEERKNFLGTTRKDTVFVLNKATGVITFGDGERGSIPLAGRKIVASEYRYGGGEETNLKPEQINILLNGNMAGLYEVRNFQAAFGGQKEQKVTDLKREAPLALENRDRAVTVKDFVTQAEGVADVARAVVLPLNHPHYPEVDIPGVVSVVILPKFDWMKAEEPVEANDNQVKAVKTRLDEVRLLTSEVFVRSVKYTKVRIHTTVIVKTNASSGQIKDQICLKVKEFFNPFKPEKRNVGEVIYGAQLIPIIMAIEGVETVEDGVSLCVNDHDIHRSSKPLRIARDSVVWFMHEDDDINLVSLAK